MKTRLHISPERRGLLLATCEDPREEISIAADSWPRITLPISGLFLQWLDSLRGLFAGNALVGVVAHGCEPFCLRVGLDGGVEFSLQGILSYNRRRLGKQDHEVRLGVCREYIE